MEAILKTPTAIIKNKIYTQYWNSEPIDLLLLIISIHIPQERSIWLRGRSYSSWPKWGQGPPFKTMLLQRQLPPCSVSHCIPRILRKKKFIQQLLIQLRSIRNFMPENQEYFMSHEVETPTTLPKFYCNLHPERLSFLNKNLIWCWWDSFGSSSLSSELSYCVMHVECSQKISDQLYNLFCCPSFHAHHLLKSYGFSLFINFFRISTQ